MSKPDVPTRHTNRNRMTLSALHRNPLCMRVRHWLHSIGYCNGARIWDQTGRATAQTPACDTARHNETETSQLPNKEAHTGFRFRSMVEATVWSRPTRERSSDSTVSASSTATKRVKQDTVHAELLIAQLGNTQWSIFGMLDRRAHRHPVR